MNFSIPQTIRRLLAPDHELSCSRRTWRRLLNGLRARGEGVHESGAFLLGERDRDKARVHDFVLYDDLDPHCLDSGIVHFDGRYFGRLWAMCRAMRCEVVADVHTHPGAPYQSPSDRDHPMIARAGHVALIVPEFARVAVDAADIGVYKYLGDKQWQSIPPARRRRFLHIGW